MTISATVTLNEGISATATTNAGISATATVEGSETNRVSINFVTNQGSIDFTAGSETAATYEVISFSNIGTFSVDGIAKAVGEQFTLASGTTYTFSRTNKSTQGEVVARAV